MADEKLTEQDVELVAAEKASQPAADAKPAAKPAPKPAAKADTKPAAQPAAEAAAQPAAKAADGKSETKPAKAAATTAQPAGNGEKSAAGAEKPAPQSAQASQDNETDGESYEEDGQGFLRGALMMAPSWLVSMVVHMVGFLVLALLATGGDSKQKPHVVVANISEDEELELDEPIDEPLLDPMDLSTEIANDAPIDSEMDISPATDLDAAPVSVELTDFGIEKAPRNDLLATIGAYTGSGVDGRGSGKAGLVRQGGGNDASERAVALALKWLADHQMPDGGWTFDLARCPTCHGQCRNSGRHDKARLAATGLAIMPFLGAGHTHKAGKYQKTVQGGLYYLMNNMKVGPQGGSMHETQGSMYSHGIASIALCEAYAMTHDKGLHTPAQAAVNFICYAQDPVGGGWRYQPRTPGDTSVVGWQIMALKSGHMAYLKVPPATVKKAFDFLDAVQSDSGAKYGYTSPGGGDATSAIGLLCRMYLGWKKDNPALQRGVKWLSGRTPSKTDFYYNYYGTQVMRHWEGEEWTKWNGVMRDQLVKTQAQKGHETGSWYEDGRHNDAGGRLYCTAMGTMILEVYYRHLPIYRSQSVEENFPL